MEVKVKVIFLDIDGVLNGWDLSEYVKYNIWNIVPSKKIKDFIRSLSHYTDVDKKRVKRLGKICKETGAKVVLSSSWRNGLLHCNGTRHYDSDENKLFWNLIDKYHIEVIDKTPRLRTSYKREDEIKAWISKHECEIENYIILDDEDTDLKSFVGSHLVKTSRNDYKGYIACSEKKWSGLANEHVKQAIRILNE